MADDPIIVTETLVLVDAIETKSGERKRVPIPLPILKMAAERSAQSFLRPSLVMRTPAVAECNRIGSTLVLHPLCMGDPI